VKLEGTGENHLFGIPAKNLPGFLNYEILPDDTVLSILHNGGNVADHLDGPVCHAGFQRLN